MLLRPARRKPDLTRILHRAAPAVDIFELCKVRLRTLLDFGRYVGGGEGGVYEFDEGRGAGGEGGGVEEGCDGGGLG